MLLTRPSAPGCGETSGALACEAVAVDPRWGSGIPGHGIAIDWVARRSYSPQKEQRRLNVQSGLRKDQVKGCALPSSSVAARDRERTEEVLREAGGPVRLWKGGDRWVRSRCCSSPKTTSASW